MLEDTGDFGGLFALPLMGIHAILTPDSKVLTFGTDLVGRQGSRMCYDVWDPVTNVHHTLKNVTKVDMFCAAALVIPSTGNVLIMGGDARPIGKVNYGITSVLQYDYRNESLFKSGDGELAYARWYPTAVTLPSGSILVMGGRGDGSHGTMADTPNPELYTPGVGWKTMVGAADPVLQTNWNYPRAWVKSTGEVIVYGAQGAKGVYSIDPTGDGAIQKIGTMPYAFSPNLPAIMFDEDKILGISYNGMLRQIDVSGATPTFQNVGTVGATRYWSNMVILADGKVMISGGSGVTNKLTNVTNQVAIWDPETRAVTFGDTAATARLYHSTTLLLPDASVLSLGGGAPGPLKNLNGEIYKPGYLFDGDGAAARPVITAAPTSIDPFGTFTMTVDDVSDIDRLTFVKNGAVTHSFNMDARFVELSWTVNANGSLTVDPPDNANILTPGSWMLFAIDDEGVPSVAKSVKVNIGGQVQVAAAKGFATLSGGATETESGSFKLVSAPEGNRGAVLFNSPVDLSHDAAFAFDVKLGYCDCGDGMTFILQSNSFGVQAPAATINGRGLRLEIGAREDGVPHEHPGDEHDDSDHPHDEHGHEDPGHDGSGGAIPGEAVDPDPDSHETHWRLTDAGTAELATEVWHRIDVSWDAGAQSLAYTIDGAFAGVLTGDVLAAFLGGRTEATFGFVGAELADGSECHEVRLVDTTFGRAAGQVVGGDDDDNVLGGGAGNDTIFGGDGRDFMLGAGGDDLLVPGCGGDRMFGGGGADTFVFNAVAEASRGGRRDAILDFVHGQDTIDLSAIDSDCKTAGDQAFSWLGDCAFDGRRGGLRFDEHALSGDIDGDRKADFFIHLAGVDVLSASDLLL